MKAKIKHIANFDKNKYHVVNGVLKRRRVRRPKKMVFLCEDCGTQHNFLPINCNKCGSMHMHEKIIGHYNKPAL